MVAKGSTRSKVLQGSVATALALFVTATVVLELAVVLEDVPPLTTTAESVRYLSADSTLLREAVDAEGMRSVFVADADITPALKSATLAIEDSRFYEHRGVDVRSAAFAVVENLGAGRVVRGASTITMQLARLLRPHPKTLGGKIGEAVFALALEREYSKAEILEAYLNRAPYGAGTRGAFAAAERYFGREHHALSLAETALLAGLPKAPTSLNPRRHPEAALARRALVLDRLAVVSNVGGSLAHKLPPVDLDTLERARREPLALAEVEDRDPLAMHFTEWVRSDIASASGADASATPRPLSGDIFTTLNADWQREAQRLTAQHIAALESGGGRDAAVVIVDNATCAVRVMVGSAGYFGARGGAVNAAAAPRQPGSTLKPFTYALAFEKGYSPRSVVADIESFYGAPNGEVFRPQNYAKVFHGPTLMGEALGRSLNVPAIRTMGVLDIGALLTRLKALGVTTLNESAEYYGLGLTLGNGEVTLVELVGAYAALARGGVPCHVGGVVATTKANATHQTPVIDPQVVAMVRHILEDERLRERAFGPHNALMLGMPIAVKTGTSSNWRDTWAVGWTDHLTIGVWTGDVEGSPTHGLAGATGAGPLFHQVARAFVRRGMKAYPAFAHGRPTALVDVEVCALSGDRPTEECDHRATVRVRASDVPSEDCTWHRRVKIDRRNGLRAGRDCPARFVVEQPVVTLPPAYAEWQQSSVLPVAPAAFSPECPDVGQIPDALVIRYPRNDEVFLVEPGYDRSRQSIEMRGEVDPPTAIAEWIVDGEVIATPKWPYVTSWALQRGDHTVQLRAKGRTSDLVKFRVK